MYPVVYDVVEKKKLTCRRVVVEKILTRRREDGGVVVEKNIKSQRTFSNNSSNLCTAIMHTKILIAYFIISDQKVKYKWRITAAKPTYYFVGIIFLCFYIIEKLT